MQSLLSEVAHVSKLQLDGIVTPFFEDSLADNSFSLGYSFRGYITFTSVNKMVQSEFDCLVNVNFLLFFIFWSALCLFFSLP